MGDQSSDKLFEINKEGPRIFTAKELIKKGYSKPSQEAYLVFKISEIDPDEFDSAKWDFRKLEGFKSGMASSLPFVVSLTELMKQKVF